MRPLHEKVLGMDVVGAVGCNEWSLSRSAPLVLSPCRRAASFPYFGGNHSPVVSSVLRIRSHSESEGLNRFRHSKIGKMPIDQVRWRLQTQEEENSDCESTSSESDADNNVPSHVDAKVGNDATDINSVSPENEARRRKCVRFADDCGSDLFCIKVMTEPNDYPPKIPKHVLQRYRGDSFCSDDEAEKSRPRASWVAQFRQPASDYIKFRETVDKGKVALENIVLKNDISHMMGTIKVANIAFDKKVFVRFTSNKWASYLDRPATYQPSTSKVYDTFCFDTEIPSNTDQVSRIEFCICYETNGVQYWDSNNGANYVLEPENNPVTKATAPRSTNQPLFGNYRHWERDDAYRLKYDNWTKFASWKQLSTEGPYW